MGAKDAEDAENDDNGQGSLAYQESTSSKPASSILSAIDLSTAYTLSMVDRQDNTNQDDIGQSEWLSSSFTVTDGGGNGQAAAAVSLTVPSVPKSTAAATASKPIAIDLSSRRKQFHTPLSARGDLIGGYFPLHESLQSSSRETHPFNKPSSREYPDYHSEMFSDSPLSTPTVPEPSRCNSPYHHHHHHHHHHYASESPQESPSTSIGMKSETPQSPPLVSMPPLGKYHPANYKNKSPSLSLQPPRSAPNTSHHTRPQAERAKSDLKSNSQLLRKYQRDMIDQATRAARRAGATIDDPGAPKLTPLGSPGPVTPMNLEDNSAAGYLVGGATRGSSYRQGENRQESDMVGRMIRAEEERRRREGQSSPLATAGGC